MAVPSEDETPNPEFITVEPSEIDLFVVRADPEFVSHNLRTLIGAGANVEALLDKLYAKEILKNVAELIAAGVSQELILARMNPFDVVKAYKEVIESGLVVDPEWLTQSLPDWMGGDESYAVDFYSNLDGVLALGVKPDDILPYVRRNKFYPSILIAVAKRFMDHGADLSVEEVNQAIETVQGTHHTLKVVENLRDLVDIGADIDVTTFVQEYNDGRNSGGKLIQHIEEIIAICGDVDINEIIKNSAPIDVEPKLDVLIRLGADPKILLESMTYEKIQEKMGWFIWAYKKAGHDVDELVKQGPYCDRVLWHLDAFMDAGASKELVLDRLTGYGALKHLKQLLDNGFTIDELVSRLGSKERVENIQLLKSHGAKIDIDASLDTLLDGEYKHYLKSQPEIVENLVKFLLKHLKTLQIEGADIRKISAQPEISESLERMMTDKHRLMFALAELKDRGVIPEASE